MNCEDYRDLFISQICGELERDKQEELQSHLNDCAECRQNRHDFSSLLGLMKQLPEPQWDERLRIKELIRRRQKWRTLVFSKAALWLISITALIGVVSYMPVRWEVSKNELSLHWGKNSSREEALAQELRKFQVQLANMQSQDRNWHLKSEERIKLLVAQNNAEEQKRYWQTLELFSNYLQYQRKADLQKIQHDITSTYDRTGHEVEKTNELLEYVLRTSATTDNNR